MDKEISVEKSRFIISFDKDMVIHRKLYNFNQSPQEGTDPKKNSWTWELKNQPAFIKEYAAPVISDLAPVIQFTMGAFKMEDFKLYDYECHPAIKMKMSA